MHSELKDCQCNFSIEETEEGYAIQVKGDKQKLKARLEALEAYRNFREKAKEAGFFPHHGKCSHGFLSLLHKHIQAFHRHGKKCHNSQTAE